MAGTRNNPNDEGHSDDNQNDANPLQGEIDAKLNEQQNANNNANENDQFSSDEELLSDQDDAPKAQEQSTPIPVEKPPKSPVKKTRKPSKSSKKLAEETKYKKIQNRRHK